MQPSPQESPLSRKGIECPGELIVELKQVGIVSDVAEARQFVVRELKSRTFDRALLFPGAPYSFRTTSALIAH